MFSKTFFDFSQEFLCSMKIIGLSQDCPAVRKYIRICSSIVNTFIILIVMTKKGFLAACVCLGAQSIEHLSSQTQTYIQKPKQLWRISKLITNCTKKEIPNKKMNGNIRLIPYRKIPVYWDFAKIPYRIGMKFLIPLGSAQQWWGWVSFKAQLQCQVQCEVWLQKMKSKISNLQTIIN